MTRLDEFLAIHLIILYMPGRGRLLLWSAFIAQIDMYRWNQGLLTRYIKLQVAHAPGMPGTFSPPPRVSDPDMHRDKCVRHVPRSMPGSLTGGFLWGWCRGNHSRHSRRMRNPQFYVSGKWPMECVYQNNILVGPYVFSEVETWDM